MELFPTLRIYVSAVAENQSGLVVETGKDRTNTS